MRKTRLTVAAAVLAAAGALAACPAWHGQATPAGQHENGVTALAEALRPMPSTHGQSTPAGFHDGGATVAGALRPMPWDSHVIHGL